MNNRFWVIERNDIPWGSKPAGTTLYYSLGPGTSWFEDISKALQFSRQEDARAYWHVYLHRDTAFSVVEHAWIAEAA